MSVVTVVWSMIAAACLTLAAVHLPVWWRDRRKHEPGLLGRRHLHGRDRVLRALACSATPQAYATRARAAHIPVTVLLISLVAFILLYLNGRLALAAAGHRAARALDPFNFLSGETPNFREIQSLRSIEFLGDRSHSRRRGESLDAAESRRPPCCWSSLSTRP